MDRYLCFIVFLCAVFFQCGAAQQNVHIVGDSAGWIIPSGSSVYTNWASGKTFMVGDILVFNFISGMHDVLQVPQDSYNACTQQNAIGAIFTAAPANITLSSTGDHYYVCTFGRHCQNGQKLSINVSAGDNPPASAPTATPATPSPAPTQSGARGPSPATVTTPETPSPAPTQSGAGGPSPTTTTTPETPSPDSNQPSSGGPEPAITISPATPPTPETPSRPSTQPDAGGPATPPPPPGSASTSLAAGFLLTLLSAGIAAIF